MREQNALQEEIDRLLIREGSLRSTIDALQLDNDVLEQNIKNLAEKLQFSEKQVVRLKKDLDCLTTEKTMNSTAAHNTSQEEKFAVIIKEYEGQCKSLSDQNDILRGDLQKLQTKLVQIQKLGSANDFSSGHKSVRAEYSETIQFNERHENEAEEKGSKSALEQKIAELEMNMKELRGERMKQMAKFAMDKSTLRKELESGFQSKLEKERKKYESLEELMKSGKNTAINQSLLDSRKVIDELKSKISSLEEELESERLKGQESILKLCREYEASRTEMQQKHDDERQQLKQDLAISLKELEKAKVALGNNMEELQNVRSQYQDDLKGHAKMIVQLENKTTGDSEKKLQEIAEKFEKEKQEMAEKHAEEVQFLHTQMQQKIDEMTLNGKQNARISLCDELEQTQGIIYQEREKMHQQIENLKKSFELEAEELRTLVEVKRRGLNKELNDEIAMLRKRLSDEAQRALERKQKEVDEEIQQKQDLHLRGLEETIQNLTKEKSQLEERLTNTINEQKNTLAIEQKKCMDIEASRLTELQTIIHEKEKNFETFQSKVSVLEEELSKSKIENSQLSSELASLKDAEVDLSLKQEKELADLETKLMEKEQVFFKLREEHEKMCREVSPVVQCSCSSNFSTDSHATKAQLLKQMKKTKDMYSKLARSEAIVKDLYCENAKLLRALEVTESKKSTANKRRLTEKDKNQVLIELLRKTCA